MSASRAVSVMNARARRRTDPRARSPLHEPLLRSDRGGIGVLDQHRLHRRAALQRHADRRSGSGRCATDRARGSIGSTDIEALDQALAPVVDRAVVVEGAAALVLPGAGDGGDAGGRMHVDRAVALARKAVAEPEEGALGRADKAGEGLDLVDRKAGDGRRPLRRAGLQMRFELGRGVGVLRQVVASRRGRRGRARA